MMMKLLLRFLRFCERSVESIVRLEEVGDDKSLTRRHNVTSRNKRLQCLKTPLFGILVSGKSCSVAIPAGELINPSAGHSACEASSWTVTQSRSRIVFSSQEFRESVRDVFLAKLQEAMSFASL